MEFKSEDGLMAAALSHYRELVIAPMLSLRYLSLPFDKVLYQLFIHSYEASKAFSRYSDSPRKPRKRTNCFQEWYTKAIEQRQVNQKIASSLAASYIVIQFNTLLLQMESGVEPELIRKQAKLAFSVLINNAQP